MTNIPTDAELIAFAVETGMRVRTGKGVVSFARAVLTRWGQPAHSGEPGYLDRLIDRLSMPPQSMMPRDLRALHAEAALMLRMQRSAQGAAPQPMEREPLTDEQIHAIYDEVARREPYAGAVTRRNIVRAIEAAHGIKGGQHGTAGRNEHGDPA